MFVALGILVCGTIIYASLTGEVDSNSIINADQESLARLLEGVRERTEATAAEKQPK